MLGTQEGIVSGQVPTPNGEPVELTCLFKGLDEVHSMQPLYSLKIILLVHGEVFYFSLKIWHEWVWEECSCFLAHYRPKEKSFSYQLVPCHNGFKVPHIFKTGVKACFHWRPDRCSTLLSQSCLWASPLPGCLYFPRDHVGLPKIAFELPKYLFNGTFCWKGFFICDYSEC